jgi:hypothetical protein
LYEGVGALLEAKLKTSDVEEKQVSELFEELAVPMKSYFIKYVFYFR